jgi:SAM-dependent methyltransferase
MKRRTAFAMAVAAVLLLAAAPALTPRPSPSPRADPHDATARGSFKRVDTWIAVFDDPERDAWQKPAEVVAALDLRPGMIVADLGAGTVYFMRHLSRAVASGGIILAIDSEEEMVAHMRARARKDGLTNVIPVVADADNPFLPAARVDRVLIVDTYHHIDDRPGYFEQVRRALAPRGRVAIIDFHTRPLPVGPKALEHKLAREFVLGEMTDAGWSLAAEHTFLPYQYFLVFEPKPNAATR